ncbi:MAG: ATP cone domain-containing protein [Archaeoglobaceae archaeon]
MSGRMSFKVKKRDGRFEEFDRNKIIKTCIKAGASFETAKKVAEEVEKKIYDGISSDDLLEIVIDVLFKYEYCRGLRYDLKRSLLRLGPSGFAFEKFVGKLLEKHGYTVQNNVVMEGECATHEVDVLAVDEKGKKYLVECKFHNLPSYTGLKDVMYTYARFLDLKDYFDFVWVFTNTKFSEEAKRYAKCRKIKLTGWNYPEVEGIETMLESKNLYPVTILKVDNSLIKAAIDLGFVFCSDIVEVGEDELQSRGLKKEVARKLYEEAKKVLC